MKGQNEISAYLENIILLVMGVFLLALPLVFTNSTTDIFLLPKQILLALTVLIALLLFGAKMISDQKVYLRQTPFNLPVFLFVLVIFLSSMMAINRFESLIAFAPLLFALLLYYLIVNMAKSESSILFLLSSLVVGGSLLALLAVLSFFKIYILPFPFTHNQFFSPLGSLLDQAVYLVLILGIAGYYAFPLLKVKSAKEIDGQSVAFTSASIIILMGLFITIYQLINPGAAGQKALLLPFETGFQTAFAAISQDAGRVAQGFFFGSGFGTYSIDFTKFKLASFNLNQDLWSLTFLRSSSFVLELLATTGFLGLGAFIYLIVKVLRSVKIKKAFSDNPIYPAFILMIIISFILPFSFVLQVTLITFLALFAAIEGLKNQDKFFDIELRFTAFKHSIIPFSSSPVSPFSPVNDIVHRQSKSEAELTKFLPITFFLIFTIFTGVTGFFVVRYAASDIIFQNSLVAAASNNGIQTYNDQVNAINIFPYRDAYHRIYSQTNLALASSLASQQPKNASPSAQIQQTILTLTQQAITSARNAVGFAPQNVANWQNLASIYRSLIGFGKDAESFAVTTSQQAIMLDPNNPQQYVNLGGLYYQLGQYENAQRQFSIAISLKPDFANAYYNLGHALESKGDLKGALTQYQAVKTLLANDKESQKKITEEIDALTKKIGTSGETEAKLQQQTSAQNQPGLDLNNKPVNQMPEQKKPVEIPGPKTSPTPTVTPTPTTTLTPSPTLSPTPAAPQP